MPQNLDYLQETASQTAGPYVHIGLAPGAAGFQLFDKELGQDIAGPNAQGERIAISGYVYDGAGAPLRDVLIEIWQANSAGIYPHESDRRFRDIEEGFRGWGRAISDFQTGSFRFETVKPGSVMGLEGRAMAPHLNLWIVARGINIGLNTRMYFSDEAEANLKDPVLNLIEIEKRRSTLIGQRQEAGDGAIPLYRFDIRLQGHEETVFFDV